MKRRHYVRDEYGRFKFQGKTERIMIRCRPEVLEMFKKASDERECTLTAFLTAAGKREALRPSGFVSENG